MDVPSVSAGMTMVAISIIIAATTAALLRILTGGKAAAGRAPPGPWALPVIGHLHLISKATPHVSLYQLSQKHGPVMMLRLGSARTLVVSSARAARAFLQAHADEAFSHRPPMELAQRVFYGGRAAVLMPNNAAWRASRKLWATELLSPASLQASKAVREEEMAALLRSLAEVPRGTAVEVRQLVFGVTVNVMGRLLFSQRSEGRFAELRDVASELSVLFVEPPLGDLIPYLRWLDPARVRPRLDASHSKLDALLRDIVDTRMQLQAKFRPKDMLTSILEFHVDASESSSSHLSIVKAMLLELLLGGTETSASTVELTMARLLSAPSTVLHKVKEELQSIVGTKRMVEERDLPNLKFLQSAIKETWRLHPPLQMLLPHFTHKEVEVEGYKIPGNTRLLINAWAIGRDKEVWQNVDMFRPDRFMPTGESNDIDVTTSTCSLITFGKGRRACPGRLLGTSMSSLILANLLHNFDLALPATFKISMEEGAGASSSLTSPLMIIPTPCI